MTTTVLAYFPSPGQGVWYLGGFPIRAYALCIIAGIIAALLIGDRRWAARGGERGVIYDIALWAVPFGLVGGRLYHVLTDWKTYFGPGGAGIRAALSIWEGGLGIWGAVALGAVGAWIGCRRKGIPLPAFGDAVAPGVVLAQAIGRLGNYFNQELYGRETTVPWGMEVFYRSDASGAVDVHSLDGVSTGQVAAVVHPTFLYELLWNLLVFVFLIWADRKFRLGHGRLFALYVAAYSVGRFGVELMRDDVATHIAGIRINVFTATFVFIGALVYFLLAPKGRENPEALEGRRSLADADEFDDESADEFEEDSLADEWSDDLMSAAKGSGVLAAATVAGEHEIEDAEAVGDHDEGEDESESAAADADTELIDAIAEDEADVADESVDTESVESESEDYSEDELEESAEVEVSAEVADDDEPADTSDDTVIVYHSPEEAATVVVYESGDGSDHGAADETVSEDETVTADETDSADDADADAAAVDEAGSDEVDAEVEDTVDDGDVSVDDVALESEVEPEPTPIVDVEDVTDGVAVDTTAEDATEDATEDEAVQPKLGKTLKRLLWGAGTRRGG